MRRGALTALAWSLCVHVAACGGGPAEDDPATTSSSSSAGGEGGAGGAAGTGGSPPAFCAPAGAGLVDVVGTPASPYFVHHPTTPGPNTPTVVFVPAGGGSRMIAEVIWANWLAQGNGREDFRVVVPYTNDNNLGDEGERLLDVRAEVLTCYGGDATAVHLAGSSLGGLAAFGLMLDHSELFATLLGAPGQFPSGDAQTWAQALAGKAVFNGVGELDDNNWRDGALSTHQALDAAGIDSVFVEFAGQGHILDPAFDETVFFDFWSSH